jgi:hypothetical protein
MKMMSLLVILLSAVNGSEYLDKVKGYNADTYLKDKVYTEYSAKQFAESKEAQRLFDENSFDLHLMNACLWYATNETRTAKKGKAFKYNGQLRDAATLFANEMVVKKFYNHIHPSNKEFKTPGDRMGLFGVTNVAMAENIHRFPVSKLDNKSYIQVSRDIVEDFYKSSGHRVNMMNTLYNSLGCGSMVEYDAKEDYHFVKVVQCFANME